MGPISKHFRRSEFACRCGCGFAAVDVVLLQVLEDLRWTFDTPVHILSGCRCRKHNTAVGGAIGSKHCLAFAADIVVGKESPATIAGYLDRLYPDRYGIGRYPTWAHIDVRDEKARWTEGK